jgi:hypothetical protein
MWGCCLLETQFDDPCRAARDLFEIFLGQLDIGSFLGLIRAVRRAFFLQADRNFFRHRFLLYVEVSNNYDRAFE